MEGFQVRHQHLPFAPNFQQETLSSRAQRFLQHFTSNEVDVLTSIPAHLEGFRQEAVVECDLLLSEGCPTGLSVNILPESVIRMEVHPPLQDNVPEERPHVIHCLYPALIRIFHFTIHFTFLHSHSSCNPHNCFPISPSPTLFQFISTLYSTTFFLASSVTLSSKT